MCIRDSAWAVLSSLMAASALILTVAPLATMVFIAIIGTALSKMAIDLDMPLLAIASAGYTVMLIVLAFLSGKRFIETLVSDQALTEKREVVSLLLREFEDTGADWLWQTDAARCLTHVSPRFAAALGVELAELEGKQLLRILAGDSWEAGNFASGLRELAEKLKRRESFADLILPVKIAGTTRWWELSCLLYTSRCV